VNAVVAANGRTRAGQPGFNQLLNLLGIHVASLTMVRTSYRLTLPQSPA
jgi:hypothetical protein